MELYISWWLRCVLLKSRAGTQVGKYLDSKMKNNIVINIKFSSLLRKLSRRAVCIVIITLGSRDELHLECFDV